MKLQFVEVAGFRGFRNKTRFDFPPGFTVLSGRNGVGKSTVLDAIDYALTGTINKFSVKEAKGGGLSDHIWWVGGERLDAYFVSIGFVDDEGKTFVVTRTREGGPNFDDQQIVEHLCKSGSASRASLNTLLQTTLIRDEFIASLSLDLPEQSRFAVVKDAIGNLVGPDYNGRANTILAAANAAKTKQDGRVKELQSDLGRLLGELTEARSAAERSTDISEAMHFIESQALALPSDLAERTVALRKTITDRRAALASIEQARKLSVETLPEFIYFGRAQVEEELRIARETLDNASRERSLAEERMALAVQVDKAERESDEFAAHMSALLEHGSAVGLLEGRCPLCEAERTVPEFEQAISSARARLSSRGERLLATAKSLEQVRISVTAAVSLAGEAQSRLSQLEVRKVTAERKRLEVSETYRRFQFSASPDDPDSAERMLFAEQDNLVRLERALSVLETSSAVDRVKTVESRVATLREQIELESHKLTGAERAVEGARQIENATKTVANQILTEQFDTVMPLLKELYRRLRPHADWTEIESDFGGKVRGSLNFIVGDGHNPQFLFSSGQRRAAGLAFLLAVHLARPWCRWQSLLLDDPVQHIDDYRALNLVEVLAAIRRTGRQVVVAVEDPALAELLCRRLRSEAGDIGRLFELHASKSGAAEIAGTRDIYPMPRLVLRPAQAL